VSAPLAAILAVAGVTLATAGLVRRRRDRRKAIEEILGLPSRPRDWGRDGGRGDGPVDGPADGRRLPGAAIQQTAVVRGAVTLAGQLVERIDARGALGSALERASIPMRPGEFVIVVAGGAVIVAGALGLLTRQWWLAGMAPVLAPVLSGAFLRHKVRKRRSAFARQLPDALAVIAGSLAAGHTFLRAIQMMCAEAEPPLSQEFARIVHETQLGDPVVDALERMAARLEVRDLSWVVQAIRVQQTTGGKLADLLHTLADFMRARDEVRREVNVLTAEGRISGWVLGALPMLLLVAISSLSPHYVRPLFRGWGLAWLAGAAGSIVVGVLMILKMASFEV